jgi:ADP-ribose pyrophosphatase YjhB (NUDIX family)
MSVQKELIMSESFAIYNKAADPMGFELTPTSLHISSFVFVKKGTTIALLKASQQHYLEFRRGKWLIPAAVLQVPEHPDDCALRVLKDQLSIEKPKLKFVNIQSHYSDHWDLCFIYESQTAKPLKAGKLFDEVKYFPAKKLPQESMAQDHVEVVDAWIKKQKSL